MVTEAENAPVSLLYWDKTNSTRSGADFFASWGSNNIVSFPVDYFSLSHFLVQSSQSLFFSLLILPFSFPSSSLSTPSLISLFFFSLPSPSPTFFLPFIFCFFFFHLHSFSCSYYCFLFPFFFCLPFFTFILPLNSLPGPPSFLFFFLLSSYFLLSLIHSFSSTTFFSSSYLGLALSVRVQAMGP